LRHGAAVDVEPSLIIFATEELVHRCFAVNDSGDAAFEDPPEEEERAGSARKRLFDPVNQDLRSHG
jgi:hypothetical protein